MYIYRGLTVFGTSKSCKIKKIYYKFPTKILQKIKYIFASYVKTQCQPCQSRANMVKAGDLVQAIGAQAEQTNTVALGDILAGMHISVLELYHLCGFNPSLLERDIELVLLLEDGIPERECHVPCGVGLQGTEYNMLSLAVPEGTLMTSAKHYRAGQSVLDCSLTNVCTLCGGRFVPGEVARLQFPGRTAGLCAASASVAPGEREARCKF